MARSLRLERDGHSSATPVARRLKQPTRTAPGQGLRLSPRCRPYSVLLPVGFAVPLPLPEARCALTAPFHPCQRQYTTRRGRSVLCGTVPGVSPPPDVIRHRLSMEPGLSSPATFRWLPERPSGRLTI